MEQTTEVGHDKLLNLLNSATLHGTKEFDQT
jgi:hypothetical protein